MTRHFDRCTDKPVEVSSLSLAMVEVDFWCLRGLEIIKHARWIQLYLRMTDHKKRYRHFVDFRHGISVLANFAYGIAVLGTPPPPTPNVPLILSERGSVE